MLLLLLTPGKLLSKISSKEMDQLSKYINRMTGLLNPEEVKRMMALILIDGFKEETKTKGRNKSFLEKLETLKSKTIDFYLGLYNDNMKLYPEIKYNCDVSTKLVEYLLQISRLRMVIEPEIQITTNVHKQSKITYLTVKGFWINDDGQKERRFLKSIGRLDEYPKGKEDVKAIEDGTVKIQSILYNEYLKHYPEE